MKSEFIGFKRYLTFQWGKKKWIQVDLIPFLSEQLKLSKSEVRRGIDDGALNITIEYDREVAS